MKFYVGEKALVKPPFHTWTEGIVIGLSKFDMPVVEYVIGDRTYRRTFFDKRLAKVKQT